MQMLESESRGIFTLYLTSCVALDQSLGLSVLLHPHPYLGIITVPTSKGSSEDKVYRIVPGT